MQKIRRKFPFFVVRRGLTFALRCPELGGGVRGTRKTGTCPLLSVSSATSRWSPPSEERSRAAHIRARGGGARGAMRGPVAGEGHVGFVWFVGRRSAKGAQRPDSNQPFTTIVRFEIARNYWAPSWRSRGARAASLSRHACRCPAHEPACLRPRPSQVHRNAVPIGRFTLAGQRAVRPTFR